MKTNSAKFKSAAILALAYFYGNDAIHLHARSIVWLKHALSFDAVKAKCSLGLLCTSLLLDIHVVIN